LNWKAKLKRKINFIKELKKKSQKRMRTKSKKIKKKSWLKDEIENNWKFTKEVKKQMKKKEEISQDQIWKSPKKKS
jgi:uncharacterized protein YacL (UPF0231 family)